MEEASLKRPDYPEPPITLKPLTRNNTQSHTQLGITLDSA
jgi:hypothetical protein